MDRTTSVLVDGLGAASATSGILNQIQGRIFALLYLEAEPMSLEDIASELQQSKSNISVNIRVLVDWHLVRLKRVGGSRKDHYEAATDFFRALQEIFERRFRWTVRQVLAASQAAREAAGQAAGSAEARRRAAAVRARLERLEAFFALVDSGIGAFVQGEAFPAERLRNVEATPARRS